jgi:hypothetical protein
MVPVAARTSRTRTLPVESCSSTTPVSRRQAVGVQVAHDGQRHLGDPPAERTAGRDRPAPTAGPLPRSPRGGSASGRAGRAVEKPRLTASSHVNANAATTSTAARSGHPVSPASSPTTTAATAPHVPGRNRVWRTEWARSVHPTPINSSANQLSPVLPSTQFS